MAITQGLCTSFMIELATGVHDFTTGTGDTFKIALYTSGATLNSATTVYSATDESSGVGYVAGGATLTSVTPVSSGSVLIFDFNDVVWAGSSLTARGALIYNSTDANKAVAVLNFGSDKVSSAQDFTIVFPPATSSQAIIRIST